MTTTEIEPANWSTFFTDLLRRRSGCAVRMEVMSPALGSFLLASGLSLSGIESDMRHRRHVISVLLGQTSDKHLTHLIRAPTHVRILDETGDKPTVLEIESSEGLTTLFTIS